MGRKAGLAVIGVAALLLAGAVGYRTLGLRAASAEAPPATAAALEAQLAETPGDVEGWRRLGAMRFAEERFADAATAYARAATLAPTRAELWSAFGEARVLADGSVSAEAHRAFATALSVDPKDYRARYFLAVEKDMAGDHRAAVDDWIALLADAPPGAPWEASVRGLVEKVAGAHRIDIAGRLPAPRIAAPSVDVATAAIPGPTREEMAAAARLNPREQDAMVQGMVGRLAARLAADPRDADGWIRLMRARTVLGDTAGAAGALATARRTFVAGTPERRRIDDAAAMFGLPGA